MRHPRLIATAGLALATRLSGDVIDHPVVR
jgi:hypothetical protein